MGIILNPTHTLPNYSSPWAWYLAQVARLDQLHAAGRLDYGQAENLRDRARRFADSVA
jgi:hypothetical protein